MSIASISYRNVFGLKQDVKNNIAFVDEQTILYPAGANVILYNIENKQQRFIHMTEKSLGISCLSISGNKKFLYLNYRFLAVGEKGNKPTCVGSKFNNSSL
jgi:hypothetical protein